MLSFPPPRRGRVGWGDGGSARRDVRRREQPPPRPSPNLEEGELASGAGNHPRASPRARRLARDRGIELAALTGSGRNGRISGDDVLTAGAAKATAGPSGIQVATIAGTIQVREWPALGQRRGDAFLIHGLFADADSYTLLARRLAKGGLRVLAIDLPGHGGSEATGTTLDQLVDTSATALRALAVGPVRLVGHSLGAMIAAKVASEGEVALDHLLLLAPAGLGKEIDAGFIDGMIAADSIADLERELAKLDGGALSPAYLQELLARIQSRRPMLRALADSINDGGVQRHSIVADLERVKVPVTAIFGIKDRIIPWQHAAQLPAHAAVHFVKNAGHMPHWTAPNLAADLLLSRR